MTQFDKRTNNKVGPTLGAAAVGALVGAAAVVLSEEKNRQRMKKELKNIQKKGQEIRSELESKVSEGQDNMPKSKTTKS